MTFSYEFYRKKEQISEKLLVQTLNLSSVKLAAARCFCALLHVNDFVTLVINTINANVNKPAAFVLIVARGR